MVATSHGSQELAISLPIFVPDSWRPHQRHFLLEPRQRKKQSRGLDGQAETSTSPYAPRSDSRQSYGSSRTSCTGTAGTKRLLETHGQIEDHRVHKQALPEIDLIQLTRSAKRIQSSVGKLDLTFLSTAQALQNCWFWEGPNIYFLS